MIGDNIKQRREKLGLTQSQLVEKAREFKSKILEGINVDSKETKCFDQAQLSKWENNERKPSLENIDLLSMLLECNIQDLTDSETKSELYEAFYNEAYTIAYRHTIDSNDEIIKTQVFKLNNAMHSNNINDMVHLFLETYLFCDEKIGNIGSLIPDALANELDNKDNEIFKLCMYRFIMGLHNGFISAKN